MNSVYVSLSLCFIFYSEVVIKPALVSQLVLVFCANQGRRKWGGGCGANLPFC